MSVKPYYKTDSCALYHCDNLELMKQLPDDYIDLIYCDILYNTGKKFKDYNDNLGTVQDSIIWYEPRLQEMFRLLKDTGSIYLQMDYRIVHYMKVKMDEIFGIKNFKNHIIWPYTGGGSSHRYFARKHDDILFYTKTDKYIYNEIKEKRIVDKTNGYNPYTKQYTDEKGRIYVLVNPLDVWNDVMYIGHNNKQRKAINYDNQKPVKLSEKIIIASSNKDSIFADFFMGSGSSGDSALNNGRKFIGCDISEKACRITQERLQKYA